MAEFFMRPGTATLQLALSVKFIAGRATSMQSRFLFRNDALQLLAFSLHKSGANLPELHPLHPWRPVEDPDELNVIYEWGPDTFVDLSRELELAGCFVFARRSVPHARSEDGRAAR